MTFLEMLSVNPFARQVWQFDAQTNLDNVFEYMCKLIIFLLWVPV